MILRIGTRASTLAVIQAEILCAALRAHYASLRTEIVRLSTRGDKVQDLPLSAIGGKGLFIREIEQALAAGQIDAAVHSLKDLPTVLPEELVLAGTLRREDPRDALVSRDGSLLEQLPEGARIGTSSLRRGAQLRFLRPALEVVDLRGNVETRLRRMEEGRCEAVVLAACGLDRAGHAGRIAERFAADRLLPAVCQGIIGVETRREDRRTREIVAAISDEDSWRMAEAERTFLHRLQGGCQVPVGCLCGFEEDTCRIEGLVASLDGRQVLRRALQGPAADSRRLAGELAQRILSEGGAEILEQIRNRAER